MDTHTMHRTSDPKTSREAAEKIAPRAPSIRDRVLSYAKARGQHGFIDDNLKAEFPSAPESSYRKRRSELAGENWLVDSGKTRSNCHGNQEVVWVHRDFVDLPPPLVERAKSQSATDKAAAREREAICAFLESPDGRRLNRQYTILAIQRGEHHKGGK